MRINYNPSSQGQSLLTFCRHTCSISTLHFLGSGVQTYSITAYTILYFLILFPSFTTQVVNIIAKNENEPESKNKQQKTFPSIPLDKENY